MITLTAGSANELFAAACQAVLRDGAMVSPRGLATREVMGAHLCLTDPRRRLVDLPPARVINPAFAVAEAMWILSGSDDPWIFQYNRGLTRYADDGRLQGAYGPRMRHWRGAIDQLDGVRQLLERDPDSRQGVIQLFDPELDTRGHRDVPCTLGYRFFLREGRLQMHTTMRSQDLWLGFPYDVFAATLLHELLAGWLHVGLGEYHHHVDSLHLYAHHQPDAARVPPHPDASAAMPAFEVPFEELDTRLAAVITGRPSLAPHWAWAEFAAVLAGYRSWTQGRRQDARTLAAVTPGETAQALRRWFTHLTDSPVPATAETASSTAEAGSAP